MKKSILSFVIIALISCGSKKERLHFPKMVAGNYHATPHHGGDTTYTCTMMDSYTHQTYYAVKISKDMFLARYHNFLDAVILKKGHENLMLEGWRSEVETIYYIQYVVDSVYENLMDYGTNGKTSSLKFFDLVDSTGFRYEGIQNNTVRQDLKKNDVVLAAISPSPDLTHWIIYGLWSVNAKRVR